MRTASLTLVLKDTIRDGGSAVLYTAYTLFSSVRSSYSHPDLLLTHPTPPTFSDHTGPQHWTFTF